MSCARIEPAAAIKPIKTKHNGRFRITSFLQLESRTCLSRESRSASPSSHSSFCEEVFSRSETRTQISKTGSSVALANEMDSVEYSGSWLQPFFPPSPIAVAIDWPWEVVSSYSSATAPGLHGISRADTLFQSRKELPENYSLAIPRSRFIYLHSLGFIRFQLSRYRRRRIHRLESDSRAPGEISGRAAHRDRRFPLRRFQEFTRLSRRLRGAEPGDARLEGTIR